MIRRMRLSSYGAIALWAAALCASATPSRIPAQPLAPQQIADAQRSDGALSQDIAPRPDDHGIDGNRALRGALMALGPFDGGQPGGARRAPDGTRVAEPSTLLLVSFGLFGLIAWSRRRR